MKFLTAFGVLTILAVVQTQFPPNFPKCKFAEETCIVKATNEVIGKYYAGLPEIGLTQFDPLHIKTMMLKRNPSSPVNVEVKLSDLELEGLKTMNVSHMQGFKSDMSGRNSLTGIIEHLNFKGHYIIDGQVMILPIKGEGTLRLVCKNLQFKYAFDLKAIQRNGQTHAALEHVKLEAEPEHVEFHFDSLFDGDKALTDTTNEFINANWKELYREIQADISKSISLIVKSLVNSFFKKYPYADYFL
ncbi:protein takeout-like [Musca domestica]|uniref:Protein takeout-like n=1 Tax=Musca domestica TaxID=7370 RepID=A0ABM3VR57_MUSDO|nr:protein takeout-like [Musca domestica]